LTRIAEFVAALFDYLHAEAEALKRGFGQVVWAVLVLLVAAGVLLAGLGFLLAAVFLALKDPLGAPLAALATSVFTLVVVGVLVWYAKTSLK